jgi:Do/DeqQ family serine protease
MALSRRVKFVLQAIVAGLALAFVITVVAPDLLSRNRPTTVEIEQSAPTSSRTTGPVSYADAVAHAAPAVVNVNTAKVVTVKPHPFFDDPIFRQFFGNPDDLIRPQKRVERSLGSGVIVSKNGYILTNNHVIQNADAIQVSLRDGRSSSAKVIGSDPDSDLAVLKVDLTNLPTITLGDSSKLRVGDVTLAIGNPFGVGQTVTMGIVSATGRNKLGINAVENFIQTDAAINPGNSGGALVDAYGNLIGINTAIFSRSGGSQGIGFAIPSNLAKGVLSDILEYGHARRGWLGIEAHVVTPSLAKAMNLDKPRGVVVVGVLRNGPAHKAGVEPGDVIIKIDGKPIHDGRDAQTAISRHRPGEAVRLTIVRDNKKQTITATAADRPPHPPTDS